MKIDTIYIKLSNNKYEILKLQEDKEAIKRYFKTDDKSEIENRNIKFVKPL